MTAGELLKSVRIGHLFDIDRKLRRELNLGKMTDELRVTFSQNGQLLSDNAEVHVLRKGQQWEIHDNDVYVIRREGKDLKVCKSILAMTQQQLADEVGVRRELIRNIEKDRDTLSKVLALRIIENFWVTDEQAEELMLVICEQALDGIVATAVRARKKLKKQYIAYPNCLKRIGVEEKKWHITS